MATSIAMRRMRRELELLAKGGAAPGISAWPREEGDRFDELDAEIRGAADTPYEGGVFRLELTIPPEYPFKPPRVRFITPIYHPNIDAQGRICLDTLVMQPKGAWKPSLNISTVLTSVQALMSSPNADDGLMVDITEEYRRNPALFRRKARECTEKHAMPGTGSKDAWKGTDPGIAETVAAEEVVAVATATMTAEAADKLEAAPSRVQRASFRRDRADSEDKIEAVDSVEEVQEIEAAIVPRRLKKRSRHR